MVKIYISKKALERAKKDRIISGNLKRYAHEITLIAEELSALKSVKGKEKIGEFTVSPKHHHNKFRVAWKRSKGKDGGDAVYICDLLYHIDDKNYTDHWNRRAAEGRITLKDYKEFIEYSNNLLLF